MLALAVGFAVIAGAPAHAHDIEHAEPAVAHIEAQRTETCHLRGCQPLVSSLLEFIGQTYGAFGGTDNYPSIAGLPEPEVHFISRARLSKKACDSGCDAFGWFPNKGNVIYIADDLDVMNDLYARGILVHELVHYVQHMTGLPQRENSCLTWKTREMHAYGIQYQWLRANRVRIATPAHNFRLAGYSRMTCDA